jgi:hypothetical protein
MILGSATSGDTNARVLMAEQLASAKLLVMAITDTQTYDFKK